MFWLAEICVKRPVFALMIIAALVVAGATAFPKLGIDRFPSMDLPTVFVRCTYPGAAAEEVESEVCQLIEEAIGTVAGIDELRSVSSDGSCHVIATFSLSRSMDAAIQDIRDAVASVAGQLPESVEPPVVMKQDTDSSPILTLAVSGPRTSSELFFLADRFVKEVIEGSPGVGSVTIAGAAERAVQVNIDSRRLTAYQLSILQIHDALVRQNAETPGGRVDQGFRERALRTLGRVADSKKFNELVVSTIHGMPIRLSDLGEVTDTTKEVRTLARLDGKPAVVLQVQRQSGENTVRVVEAVKTRLPRCENLLPNDVKVTVIQDQSRYILTAIHELERHLISGSILACITVLLFMRSWRSTLIAAVAIPTSIIATFAFMKAFGFTLNNVTMLALVLMVGVVIDDAIVVLENVFHCIEEKGMSPYQASISGTREIGFAVLSTTTSLVIVFLPVSFLSSVTGKMLYEFGVTATVAILVSMLVSFTLTPMMCSKLLKPAVSGAATSRGGFYHWIEVSYLWMLRGSMRFRWLVLLLSIGVVAANVPLYFLVQQDYIPTNVDESEFEVNLNLPEGASLAAMNEVMLIAEQEIAEIDGVETILSTVGTRGFGGVNRGSIFVRLVDSSERTFSASRFWKGLLRGDTQAAFRGNFSQRDKMNEVRDRLGGLAGVRASVRNQTSLRQGAPVDIDFSITGPDIQSLGEFSELLRERLMLPPGDPLHIPGIVDVDTTLRLDKPDLLVSIDRQRAAAMGVDAQEIADTLRVAVGGDDRVSRYRDENVDDAYDVELRLVGLDRNDVQSISQLYVRSKPNSVQQASLAFGEDLPSVGALIRIDNVVNFTSGQSAARIDRLDRQRMVAIRANLAPGYSIGDRVKAIQSAVDEIGMPPGFETRVMGKGRELEKTLQEFRWIFVLSFIFMYIVLAAQFEHLLHPLTILFTLPLAVPFGLISIYFGGETLNVYSALGILVLFGVVKKAAILQVDHTNALVAKGVPRAEAIIQANRDRLRPILMTTIAFVAGLFPLLIATGPGAEERRSIAVLAVGGQTLSLLLTLLAVPVIYSYLDDLSNLLRSRKPTAELNQPSLAEQAPRTLVPEN